MQGDGLTENVRSSSVTRRACDQCNFRKVKCRPPEIGSYPCVSCTRNRLECRRDKVEKRRGPRSTRIQALQIEQSQPSSSRTSEHAGSSGIGSTSNHPTDSIVVTQAEPSAPIPSYPMPEAVDAEEGSSEWWLDQMLEPGHTDHLFDGLVASSVATSDFRTLPFVDWARASALDFTGGSESLHGTDFMWQGQDARSPESRDRIALDQSLDIYFQSFYPMFPILNQTRVRSSVPSYLTRLANPDSRPKNATDKMLDSILAMIECRDHGLNPLLTPHHTQMISQPFDPAELCTPSVDVVMSRLHIFVSYQSLGQRLAAWYHLQEAMTLMLMLGQPDAMTDRGEEHLRLYWVLFIAERAYVALQQLPAKVDRPLRLADSAYCSTPHFGLPLHGLSDFPMSHLRLFSLIQADQVPCWRGTCEAPRGCTAWTVEQALLTMASFKEEMSSAKEMWDRRIGLTVQSVNLIITIAWFRDRFWNVFLRHGLIGSSNHDSLGFPVIDENLYEVTEFCVRVKIADFDKGVDCNAKLTDLAITALSVVKLVNKNSLGVPAPSEVYPEWPALASRLLASVYKILGLLNMLATDGDTFCRDVRQALADAT